MNFLIHKTLAIIFTFYFLKIVIKPTLREIIMVWAVYLDHSRTSATVFIFHATAIRKEKKTIVIHFV